MRVRSVPLGHHKYLTKAAHALILGRDLATPKRAIHRPNFEAFKNRRETRSSRSSSFHLVHDSRSLGCPDEHGKWNCPTSSQGPDPSRSPRLLARLIAKRFSSEAKQTSIATRREVGKFHLLAAGDVLDSLLTYPMEAQIHYHELRASLP